jgi:hypothetical protein
MLPELPKTTKNYDQKTPEKNKGCERVKVIQKSNNQLY